MRVGRIVSQKFSGTFADVYVLLSVQSFSYIQP